MIVGAGAGQVPIINYCKQQGLYTIVVSPHGPYPGISIADKHIDEDIYNVDALVDIGKKYDIDYVISDQSDFAVPIVAYVAEKLNLPGNSLEVACTYTYKTRFRDFCTRNKIPVPKSYEYDPTVSDINEVHKLKLPLVVKPTDSQGSRGIIKINKFEDLDNAIKDALSFSKHKKVVIEEFFEGREVVCEGFVLNGEYYHVGFGDRVYFNLQDKFIPSKTIFPSTINEKSKQAIIINERRIASLLKPTFGIVHSEYLINSDGDFIVIESALRGGGVYIASHLIPLSTGIDLTAVLFDAMIGDYQKCISHLTKQYEYSAEYLCFYLNEGTVTSMSDKNWIQDIPSIRVADIENIKVGDDIPKFEHKGMRKGPFIISGRDLTEINEVEDKIKENLIIEVDDAQGINWN